MLMREIWLNLAVAAAWCVGGWDAAAVLVPLTLTVLAYAFAHDDSPDTAHYRDVLISLERERAAREQRRSCS